MKSICFFWQRALLTVLLILPMQAVMALDLVDRAVLTGLASDNNSEKIESINALGQLTSPGAVAILEALSNDKVLVTPDGNILIAQTSGKAYDPTTGQTIDTPAGADTITINNRLRRAVQAAQASAELYSPTRSVKLAAVTRLQKEADASRIPIITKALEKEQDPEIKQALIIALASSSVKGSDPVARRQAAFILGESGDAGFRPVLSAMLQKDEKGKFSEPESDVRLAAQTAINQIDRHQTIVAWVGNIFFGISLGSVLLLAALGLAITFGLMGIINMAHGELLMIGAYATYTVQLLFKTYLPGLIDLYLLAALPVAFFATAFVGMALERTVIRWLYGRPLETLLATWGISLMLMQAVRSFFGAQNVEVANPSWMTGGITVLGGLVLTYNRMVIIAFAFSVVGIVWLVLNRTRLGLFVRAITQNRRMADCVGVATGKIDMLAFGLGAGIAGLAGVALSQLGNVGPDLGRGFIVDSLMVVVLGGVGQLAGTVVAAMGLGMLNKFIEPFWGAVIAKIAILLFIVLFVQKRPQGLFAPKGRSAE